MWNALDDDERMRNVDSVSVIQCVDSRRYNGGKEWWTKMKRISHKKVYNATSGESIRGYRRGRWET